MGVLDHLRPFERRVLRLAGEGVDVDEIGRRFRRSPETIRRVLALAELPRASRAETGSGDGLRSLERRVLRWRDAGAGYDEIAPRFRRSPGFVRQVEALARYKLRG